MACELVVGFGDDDRDQTKRYARGEGKEEEEEEGGTMTDVDRESNELKSRRRRGTEADNFFLPLLPRSRSHKHGQGTSPMRAREMWADRWDR